MTRLIISMVVYKTPTAQLDRVFKLILKGLSDIRYEVHIMDNADDKKLFEWTTKNKFNYHTLKSNVGFGKGHNEIFKRTYQKDTTYLFLNPDLYLSGENVKKIFALFKKHPHVGLISPKLLNPNGSVQLICRFIPSPFTLVKRFLFKNAYDTLPKTLYRKDNALVPFIHGACFFVRGDIFKSVGGFDSRYFMYMEDLDLCRKIQFHKYSVMLCNEVTAVHDLNKGSSKHLKLFFHHVWSLIQYFNQWGWLNDKERKKINEIFRQNLNVKHL